MYMKYLQTKNYGRCATAVCLPDTSCRALPNPRLTRRVRTTTSARLARRARISPAARYGGDGRPRERLAGVFRERDEVEAVPRAGSRLRRARQRGYTRAGGRGAQHAHFRAPSGRSARVVRCVSRFESSQNWARGESAGAIVLSRDTDGRAKHGIAPVTRASAGLHVCGRSGSATRTLPRNLRAERARRQVRLEVRELAELVEARRVSARAPRRGARCVRARRPSRPRAP
jgi:hypothetical protein